VILTLRGHNCTPVVILLLCIVLAVDFMYTYCYIVLYIHTQVLGVIEAAAEVVQLLLPRRQQQVAWCIKEAVPRALLAIGTDDLRSVPREALTEGVTRLTTLANGGTSSNTSVNSTSAAAAVGAARAAEQLQLGLALKLFRCAQLEKRLQGLMLIRELVLAVDSSAAKQAPGQRTASFNGVAAHVLAPLPTAGSQQQQQQRPFVWADAAFVQDWLLQSEVIEELLGGSSHVELVKRADAVLSFLARRGALTALHLECLWACAEGRHEAVVSVLYSQILDLVPALQPHLRLFLFSCIAGTPFARYSAQTLQLVHDFTLKALQAARKSSAAAATAGASAAQGASSAASSAAGAGSTGATAGAAGSSSSGTAAAGGSATTAGGSADTSCGGAAAANDGSAAAAGRGDGLRKGQVVHCVERAWLGFSVLWQYAMDDPTTEAAGTQLLSTELTEMAVELLVALLAEPEIVPERTSLIGRCLENVAQQRSVPASLMVLKRAISTAVASSATPRWFSMRSASSSSSSSTLEGLQRSRDVLGSVITELESYCTYVSAHYGAAAAASASTAERLNSGRLRLRGVPTRFTHLQHLQARLDFLMFALTRSSLSLTETQLDTLWSCLVLQACTPQAADLALEWLQRACADPADDDTLAAAAASAATPSGSASPLVDSSSSSSAALGPLMRAYLFTAKLETAEEVVTMRPAAARLFLLLFVQLNGRTRAMRRVPAAPLSAAAAAAAVERAASSTDAAQAQEAALLSGWVRHSMELAGLDMLWAMALDAADEVVATSACALLIELHRRLGSKLAAKSDKISDQFVQQCLGKLAEAVPLMLASGRIAATNAASKSSSAIVTTATTAAAAAESTAATAAVPTAAVALHTRRVRRCIGLLRRFLAAKSTAGTSSSSSSNSAAVAASQSGADSEAVVEVVTGPQLLPAVEVRLPGSASVLELRAALARHFDEVSVVYICTAVCVSLKYVVCGVVLEVAFGVVREANAMLLQEHSALNYAKHLHAAMRITW
jgi:hypothetical protein